MRLAIHLMDVFARGHSSLVMKWLPKGSNMGNLLLSFQTVGCLHCSTQRMLQEGRVESGVSAKAKFRIHHHTS